MMPKTVAEFFTWFAQGYRTLRESGHLMLWLLRGAFGAIIIGFAWFFFNLYAGAEANAASTADPESGKLAFGAILGLGFLVLVTDILIRNKQITTISAVYFGLLLGLVLGALFSMALEPFVVGSENQHVKALAQPLRLFVTLICCYFSVSTLLQTKDEFRFIIPYVEFSKQ